MVKILLPNQSAQWRSYLHRLPPGLQDIHFYPEMMLPYEEASLGHGMLAVVEQGNEFMIQPLLEMKDGVVRHPYNFGGPVATEGFEPTGAIFPSTFTLNPFLHEHQNKLINQQAKYTKDTVWIDLTKPLALRQTTRHMAEKAANAGVTVEKVDPTYLDIVVFHQIYSQHMADVHASNHWRFPLIWFKVLLGQLGKAMSTLMFAKHKNNVVGACLLIHDHEVCYYHFAVSKREPKGIAHRMVIQAADLARFKGFKKFHLGSGLKPDDGLFTFKAGFSNLRLPVLTYVTGK